MAPFILSPVRPRVVSPETGDVLFLEDEVAQWLETADRGAFEIVGQSGSGKTTALARLASTFQSFHAVRFLDEPSANEALAATLQGPLIYTTRQPLRGSAASLRLASWTDDALFRGAVLSHADLTDAQLRRVRLAEAALDGAKLRRADLTESDLEFVKLTDADWEFANFTRADLTGSCLPRARLRGACFWQAGLADVRWEGADLRDVDFTLASFHLGSSRSGLVGSPLACEGSRTGFYTDDFDEQGFKSPEEIRKADLRGADLRGAIVDGADFYLVDLRGARYDAPQAQHFARCRAILFDAIPG